MTDLLARSIALARPAERQRVLIFTNSVAMGGMEKHIELLARDLDRRRFEIFAICPDWEETRPLIGRLERVADHLAVITPDRRHGLRRQLKEIVTLYRRLREWKIDTIHLHSTTFKGEIWTAVVARAAGVKRLVVTEHLAPEAGPPLVQLILRNLFSWLVDEIVCVSWKNRETRRQYLATPLAKTSVVNNGIDLAEFAPIPTATLADLRQRCGLPEGARIVGTAIRFEPEKGLEYLIDAMPQIRAEAPETHFLLVGDGKLRARLEQRVAAVGLNDCVHFVGFQADPRPYIALMDVFVLPVPVGSMSIALLEAMAMERAVVITFGGEGEAVIDGENGLTAEPRNPAALAKTVLSILSDPARQQALGAAARQRVEAEFSSGQAAKRLSRLYLHR